MHKELSAEESLAILLRSKLSKKVGKQFYFCSFESETGGPCNKPVTEEG